MQCLNFVSAMTLMTQTVCNSVQPKDFKLLKVNTLLCTLQFTALYCTALYYKLWHCIALHCSALHCFALYCTPEGSLSVIKIFVYLVFDHFNTSQLHLFTTHIGCRKCYSEVNRGGRWLERDGPCSFPFYLLNQLMRAKSEGKK